MVRTILPLLLGSVCTAATIRVPADQRTIQSAINVAADGDTISVAAGVYAEAIVLNEGLTIEGAGADVTVISGAGFKPVVVGASRSRISGFTIVGANDDDIDGIVCSEIDGFEISRNIIRDCT